MDTSNRKDSCYKDREGTLTVQVIEGRRVLMGGESGLVWHQDTTKYPLATSRSRGNGICFRCRGTGKAKISQCRILGYLCNNCHDTGVCSRCRGTGFDKFGAPCCDCANHMPFDADSNRMTYLWRYSQEDLED